MSPGAAATRSATSRWTISTRRRGRGRLAQEPVEDRAGDVVRDVGDDVVGLGDEVDEVLVQRVALHDPQGACLQLRLERLPQDAHEPPVQLHRGHLRARREQAAGEEPETRPDLEDRRARARDPPRARMRSRISTSARKFWERLWRARRPASRSRRWTYRGSSRRSPVRPRSLIERGAATAARRGPGRRARPRRTAGRRLHRSSPRCRCTGPGAGSPSRSHGPPPGRRSASRSAVLEATPPPITIPRAPTSSAARIVLVASTSTTESWKPHASSATTASGNGPPSRSSAGKAGVGPRLANDPSRRGLEARERQVVGVAQPGPREDAVPGDRPRRRPG